MIVEAIKWSKVDGQLEILDQTQLPLNDFYIRIKNVEDAWQAINKMQVRGAPAIAIVGSLSLAVQILQDSDIYEDKTALLQAIEAHLRYLVQARPTAVNMKTAANELLSLANDLTKDDTCTLSKMRDKFIDHIDEMLKLDVANNKAIGDLGARDILRNSPKGSSIKILTHCNTGSLATAGYGTALGVIRSLNEMGRLGYVYCTETRPYCQGARLTAYELVYDEIPATLICDNMVGALMKTKQLAAVVVGADRVAANGDTANKIGTYQIAILAKYHDVPFYVAAPLTSVDFEMPDGDNIIIEERPEHEMIYMNKQRIAALGIKCWNPAFDVTPASLITGIITEIGVFKPSELINAKEKRISRENIFS